MRTRPSPPADESWVPFQKAGHRAQTYPQPKSTLWACPGRPGCYRCREITRVDARQSGRSFSPATQDRVPAAPELFLLRVSPASLPSLCPHPVNAQQVAAAEMHPPLQVELRRVHLVCASPMRVLPETCSAPRRRRLKDLVPAGFAHESCLQRASPSVTPSCCL